MGLATPGTIGQRNSAIDVVRGVLVLLVILGHFAELSHRESFLTWIGVGFRMPVFIGLSGYLFNLEQARQLSFAEMLRKYYRRLILPWLTACVVVLTLTGAINWLAPWAIVLRPPYHLWFVPVLLTFFLAARACRLAPVTMLAIALPGSIGAMYLLGVGHYAAPLAPWLPDRRYFIYPLYFTLGLWVARRPPDPRIRVASLALAGLGLLWWSRLYDHPSLSGEVAAALMISLPLIGLLPWIRVSGLSLPGIGAVGRDSLFLYLWHPLAFALWSAVGVSGLPQLVLSFALILLAWRGIAKSEPLSIILGVRPRRIAARTSVPAECVQPAGDTA